MRIPETSSTAGQEVNEHSKIKDDNPFVMNIYHQKEMLTKIEALNLLNHITAVLLMYESK